MLSLDLLIPALEHTIFAVVLLLFFLHYDDRSNDFLLHFCLSIFPIKFRSCARMPIKHWQKFRSFYFILRFDIYIHFSTAKIKCFSYFLLKSINRLDFFVFTANFFAIYNFSSIQMRT